MTDQVKTSSGGSARSGEIPNVIANKWTGHVMMIASSLLFIMDFRFQQKIIANITESDLNTVLFGSRLIWLILTLPNAGHYGHQFVRRIYWIWRGSGRTVSAGSLAQTPDSSGDFYALEALSTDGPALGEGGSFTCLRQKRFAGRPHWADGCSFFAPARRGGKQDLYAHGDLAFSRETDGLSHVGLVKTMGGLGETRCQKQAGKHQAGQHHPEQERAGQQHAGPFNS